MSAARRGSAPLIARSAEQALIRAARVERRHLLLSGDLGVGKSRLLRWAADDAVEHGWCVERVLATPSLTDVPFGAFTHLLPTEPTGAPNDALVGLIGRLRSLSDTDHRLLLVVDDAGWLDPLSAAVVNQAAMLGLALVVATARTGDALPPALHELATTDGFDTIGVAPLDAAATTDLAEALTGRTLASGFTAWLWRTTAGNPLFVHEVVIDALDRHAAARLESVADEPLATSVADVVNARLGRLGEAERRQLETVAIAGAVSVALVESMGDAASLTRLEDRRLVTITSDRDRWEVRLAHPLFGDAIQSTMSTTRRREQALLIADRIERWGMRRSDDALRVAMARRAAGAAVTPEVAVAAAQIAHTRGAHALAEQFSRAAFHDAPTVTSGILLAYALMYQGRAVDADVLLDSLEPIIAGAEDRALVATTQALNAMHGLVDIERADAIVTHHAPLVDGAWRWELSGPAIGVDLYAGRIADAVAGVDAALADPELPPRAQLGVLIAGLIPLFLAGRAELAVTLGRQLQQEFLRFSGDVPTLRVQAELELAEALAWAGDLQAARALVEALRVRAEQEGDAAGMVIITIVSGLVGTHAGEHRQAAHALAALGSLDHSAYRPWPPYLYGRLAAVAHRVGDHDDGRQYLGRIAAHERPGLQLHQLCSERARAEDRAAHGDLPGGVAALRAVRERALVMGNRAEALCAAVRVAALAATGPDLVAARAVSSTFQGVLGHVLTVAFDAFAAGDTGALASAANRLHGRGYVLLADDLDLLARRRAVATTEPRGSTLSTRLTDREQEIARLVEHGESDADIAARLGISVRTVHAHVRSIFAKLGVSRRRDVRGDIGDA